VSRSEAEPDLRRRIPSVDQVLQNADVRGLLATYGRSVVVRAVRRFLEDARRRAGSGDGGALGAMLDAIGPALRERVAKAAAPSLVPVINATGVVVHTNLGRAPLARDAAARVAAIAASYSNLEYDLERGERGHRETHAETRLREMLGAEAVVVVNNNAAAVMLAVNTFGEGREVIVSRGELVEIGGSFRIPEVLKKGGARLREVGTTNRTRIADYEHAVSRESGLVLKVHPSNFRVVGFTESATLEELVELSRRRGLPLVEDLGSGLLEPLPALPDEPVVRSELAAGVDVVTFSGDKLLGGPQAGFAAGRRERVDAMRKNPLYRALRVDKMTLAALDVTLAAHEAGRAAEHVPVLRMLSTSAADVRRRAEALAAALRPLPLEVEVSPGSSAVGGGAAPLAEIETALVAIRHRSLTADALSAWLRAGEPPVIARVNEDRLVLDLRTVSPEEEPLLRAALERAAREA
jgi:L-seryl-tRNA(Ser) seleniumtransferase